MFDIKIDLNLKGALYRKKKKFFYICAYFIYWQFFKVSHMNLKYNYTH